MSRVEVAMYRNGGPWVQLADLLAKVPANNWTWSLVEFDGVGQMPLNESVLDFIKGLREQRPDTVRENFEKRLHRVATNPDLG